MNSLFFFNESPNIEGKTLNQCKDCDAIKRRAYRSDKYRKINIERKKLLTDQGLKICSLCKDTLPLKYFRSNGPDRKRSQCGICHRLSQGNKNGWNVSITKKDIITTLENQDFKCFYSGLDLTLEEEKFNSISIDRFDSRLGYTLENIVITIPSINRMKLNLDSQVFIDLCKQISQHNLDIPEETNFYSLGNLSRHSTGEETPQEAPTE